ncbi:MAG: methylenetetrahydrofolate--tRNA-(uracil(54)-C(5))-methyltransferase (FADH(2)-oxidizing) TrmFO [Kiritimatiellae bacterium]|nr:methylenetetrahydrofolate--tRNA-(uracil(54)-C(5))-methyltransferase (FADH(2)-oxidizing) TrmFO [Kiritimatiellia bacterium]
MTSTGPVTVVGGGLAGCEAAWQLARRGIRVRLFEMRPARMTGAHRTDRLAELVCSNSLGSMLPDRASGLLMTELISCGSLLLRCASVTAVPAGGALAVDRDRFAAAVTAAIEAEPLIELIREEVLAVPPSPVIIASGPLTSPALAGALARLTGRDHLFFFDAISPVVDGATVDRSIAFAASRYGRDASGAGDYLNCPFTREEYERFVDALISAERAPLREFERDIEQGVRAGQGPLFEGCLPIELLARRGREAPAFGPLRPVGLRDPRTGRRPYAVLQLRREDAAGERWNLVGCQTNLRESEQQRVFRLVPGLQNARFLRFGQMHRNTYLCAPLLLDRSLQLRGVAGCWIAGQLCGVEGYLGNIATGLVAGCAAAAAVLGRPPPAWPDETMIGSLLRALVTSAPDTFQPIKANLGLLPPLPTPCARTERAQRFAARAIAALNTVRTSFAAGRDDPPPTCGTTSATPSGV